MVTGSWHQQWSYYKTPTRLCQLNAHCWQHAQVDQMQGRVAAEWVWWTFSTHCFTVHSETVCRESPCHLPWVWWTFSAYCFTVHSETVCRESITPTPSPSGPQCQASSSQPLNLFTVDNHHSWLRGRERRGTAAGFARSCSIKGHSSSSSSQLHSELMLVTGAHDSAAVHLDGGPFCSS